MKTSAFLEQLTLNTEKDLLFECEGIEKVPFNYHITEIKNLTIESVDCGGRPSSDKQTVVQLWLSANEKPDYKMTNQKALSIFNIVDKIKAIDKGTEIFFEYQASGFPTSNYAVASIEQGSHFTKVILGTQITKCKPKYELEMAGNACAPGSGCC